MTNQPYINKSEIADTIIKIEKQEIQYQTLEKLIDPVSDIFDAKRLEKMEKNITFTREKLIKKYKNRQDYKKLNDIEIINKKEFRDKQTDLIKMKETVISKFIIVSNNPYPKKYYLIINHVTRQVI